MFIRLLFSFAALLFSSMGFAQIYAEISSGYSFTTVSPNFRNTFELDSRVDSSFGRDHQISFSGPISSKMRYLFRMGYNQHRIHVFHSKRESQSFTEQLDGRMQSRYLNLMAAPIWHKGERLEFTYGLGFYAGFLFYSRFDGTLKIIDGTETTVYELRNSTPMSYRDMATGLFTTLGLHYSLSPKIKVGLATDLILFLSAKNLIFQDTGSVNEINMRLGVSYKFEKRPDDL